MKFVGSFSIDRDSIQLPLCQIWAIFIKQKTWCRLFKVWADWCWQSGIRQIGWFSKSLHHLFCFIKLAQIWYISTWRLSLSILKDPTNFIFLKVIGILYYSFIHIIYNTYIRFASSERVQAFMMRAEPNTHKCNRTEPSHAAQFVIFYQLLSIECFSDISFIPFT